MQGEMTRRILNDQECRLCVGNVIVASLADRNALEQIVATEKRLTKLCEVGITMQLDAELPAHRAGTAVAAGEIKRLDLRNRARRLDARRDGGCILLEGNEFAAVAYI